MDAKSTNQNAQHSTESTDTNTPTQKVLAKC